MTDHARKIVPDTDDTDAGILRRDDAGRTADLTAGCDTARPDRRVTGGQTAAVTRRRLLALVGSGAIGTVAGCAGLGGGSDDSTPTAFPDAGWTGSRFERTYEGGVLSSSPSSDLAPTDGFADAEWAREADLQVLPVTTLNGAGEGSLRRAVNQSGPRVVVFEVGGVVDLAERDLVVDEGNCWIAGQTAPSPGVTLIRGGFRAAAENVVVQHLRSRPGDEPDRSGSEGGTVDAMEVTDAAANVVFDHCTATWGSDENMSDAGGDSVTFSNNLIAEGLHDSFHPDGPHSFGTLVLQGSSEVAIFGNVWAHNMGRHPVLKGGTTSVVVNNLAYNFGWFAVIMGGDGTHAARTSLVGNVYRSAPPRALVTPGENVSHTPELYAVDNVSPEGAPVYSGRITELDEKPVWSSELSAFPASEVPSHDLAAAGARPADRTPHDERIVSDVREGTGAVIDSQSDVGGYPDLTATERPLNVPDRGEELGDWLAAHTRAVEVPGSDPP